MKLLYNALFKYIHNLIISFMIVIKCIKTDVLKQMNNIIFHAISAISAISVIKYFFKVHF